MIDHVKLFVSDYRWSRAFFEQALAPLDYRVIVSRDGEAGFGIDFPHLWIAQSDRPTTAHLALRAKTRAAVDEFHAEALAAGGVENGPPGPRRRYHPNYYGAFVLDRDANNLEAVCHDAPGTR